MSSVSWAQLLRAGDHPLPFPPVQRPALPALLHPPEGSASHQLSLARLCVLLFSSCHLGSLSSRTLSGTG